MQGTATPSGDSTLIRGKMSSQLLGTFYVNGAVTANGVFAELKRDSLGARVGGMTGIRATSDRGSIGGDPPFAVRNASQRRDDASVMQTVLARRLGSSPSGVARMESDDPSVSLELLMRALLALGAADGTWPARYSPDVTIAEASATMSASLRP
jgi:hypothetical protein